MAIDAWAGTLATDAPLGAGGHTRAVEKRLVFAWCPLALPYTIGFHAITH